MTVDELTVGELTVDELTLDDLTWYPLLCSDVSSASFRLDAPRNYFGFKN